MFEILEYQDHFKIYELKDRQTASWVKVAPERGGLIIGFGINDQELLYLDPATFYDPSVNVRGGIPILFPICGKLENDEYRWDGRAYRMKSHGFARLLPWKVISRETQVQASLTLRLVSDAQTKTEYPFDFEINFTYSLSGTELVITQEYRNLSGNDMPIYPGFHPYFRAADKSRIQYGTTATQYFDYADSQVKPYIRDIDLTAEAEAKMLLDHPAGSITFTDPVLKRRIHQTYSREFKYPVLWSVPGKDFICVEPFMAKPNSFNTKQDLYFIKPGANYRSFLTIRGELL